MSRRSTRLVQPDDDAASTSSTASTSQISYRESPVRIFKKKTGGRRTGPSRSSGDVLSQYRDFEEAGPEDDWGSEAEHRATPPRKVTSSYRTFSAEPLPTPRGSPALVSSLQEVQGHSSGYSSCEEAYSRPGLKSAPPPAEEFGFQDMIRSPAQMMTMLFWKLGSAWYTLTSGLSLLDVFLLSRRTAAVKKAVLLFFLFAFLLFAVWYWYPHISCFFTLRAMKSTPVVSAPVSTVPQGVAVTPGLSDLRDEINSRFREREARWTEEREKAMHEEERWREERGREQKNMLRELTQLKQDGDKLKLFSETLKTEIRDLQQTVKSGDVEHRSRLGQETAGLDRQISDLRAELTSLHSATDSLQQRVDSQEANNAKMQAELSAWLVEQLSSGSLGAGLVMQPELQGALEGLEKRLLDRLAEDGVKNRGRPGGAWGRPCSERGRGPSLCRMFIRLCTER
ncbi:hypothetical protein COCON_G00024810 [Conger conger]|uniref:Uncharacterized protein n=1 Tax=Conger conger TaxID=82655 RepID=A0A9Q1DXI0_CONCO|nr:hypothetical protein COCON_G00024810 [Conger conger]